MSLKASDRQIWKMDLFACDPHSGKEAKWLLGSMWNSKWATFRENSEFHDPQMVDWPGDQCQNAQMPKISEWGPVSIYINTRGEHNPPHFHAVSGEWDAAIRIGDFAVMAGRLPPKVLGQVVEWAALHQGELIQEWDNMRAGLPLNRIAPLS